MQQAAASPYNASQESHITQLRCRPAMPENKLRERVASGTGALLPRHCWTAVPPARAGPLSQPSTLKDLFPLLESSSGPAQPRRAGNLSAVPFCPKVFLAVALSVRESSEFPAPPAEKTGRRTNSQRPVCPDLPSPRGTEPARTSSIISIAHPSSAPSSLVRPLPARHSPVRHDASCAAYAPSPATIMPPSNSFERAASHCLSATGCYDGMEGLPASQKPSPSLPPSALFPSGIPIPRGERRGSHSQSLLTVPPADPPRLSPAPPLVRLLVPLSNPAIRGHHTGCRWTR